VQYKYNGKNQTKKTELMVGEEKGEQLYKEPVHNILYCRWYWSSDLVWGVYIAENIMLAITAYNYSYW